MALDVLDLQRQLNMTSGSADEIDVVKLPRLLTAATRHVESDLGFKLDDATEFPDGAPEDVEQAVLMLAAHWYENAEASVVGVSAQAVPFGYAEIIANHRSYSFGG